MGTKLPFEPACLGLNLSQGAAFELALSNNVALIQGPPGTGKSYIGVKLVECLLLNSPVKPILLVCFTNHALDQFLADILKALPESYDKQESGGGPSMKRYKNLASGNGKRDTEIFIWNRG
eukprot:Gregarina_sp_Poly_1__11049@NODE_886_length_5840_cov_23_566603_g633_i0_p6_GENE_NODE_886_length_5840_cov_23_566603_g633_i0NODE_886_length_5840_cov_23_566603_g633_i0_p6_ORF_typecomplete_len121_score10_97AAA_11/PF13086_6/4_7e19AAA_30/PF13604_6/2_3e10AAA_19/PF13245_6/2_7e09ResIII/PF04851_15/5_4e07UvrDhelicase/PF00580_21/2_1e06PhoH/PF02562_16/2_4e05DUF2075/PF09848_9/4_1e05AAA_22/PF13401_6/0_00055NACHT/PF05729_12/0_0058AAA_25/PF13481_6/0_007ATPase/PF06745_13/0_012IstB_IS21/PF01695_17/0_012PPV_E1_C/PF00